MAHAPDDERDPHRLSRRDFVGAALAIGALTTVRGRVDLSSSALLPHRAAPAPISPFELEELTLADLRAGLQSGRFTSRSITEGYLARIEEVDPRLHSVIETNPDALAIADQLDEERASKGERSPMHGIPVLVKDNIATADRMMSTAGSLALQGVTPPRDAFVVKQLRDAGAVILGKANLSEWANFRSSHSSSGWSARGGQCRNPYALDRTPSGSSSGSAAATAANLCPVAVGTETDGSIVSPSAACSLVGIKPTVGLVSRNGIVPIAHSQDTAGPIGRTVSDAAILLSAMAGYDPHDPYTSAGRSHVVADYIARLDPDALRGARIGVPRPHYYGYSNATDELMQNAIDVMKTQGAVIVDPAPIATAGKFSEPEFQVLLYEFKTDLNLFLASLGPSSPVRSLGDLIAFNEKNTEREMPYFGQDLLLEAQKKGSLRDPEYTKALTACQTLSRAKGIDATMAKYKLDALVAPTHGPPWLIDLVNGDCANGGSSSLAAVSGYPSITVPAGYVFGLPVGISFIGRSWSEESLIRFAYAYEQASKLRHPPALAPTVNLSAH